MPYKMYTLWLCGLIDYSVCAFLFACANDAAQNAPQISRKENRGKSARQDTAYQRQGKLTDGGYAKDKEHGDREQGGNGCIE